MENRFLLMFLLLLLLQGYDLLVDGQSSNCGGPMYRNGRGFFTSHAGYNGRSKYPKSNCTWVLTAEGLNNRVALTFENFFLEDDDGCKFDSVRIFDGTSASLGDSSAPILGRFCGQKKPPRLVSSGQNLTVVFVADNSVSKLGFRAKFETIRAAYLTTQPEACGTDAHKAKAVTVQIFASPKMMRTWRWNFPLKAERGKEAAGEELMVKLNQLFSEKRLGYGNSVTYTLAQNGVEILYQDVVSSVLEGGLDTVHSARRFCEKLNNHKAGKKWDAAVIVIDISERPEKLISGAAAAHAGICAANLNCALLIGSEDKATLGLIDRQLAHEFGHLFGVQQACRWDEHCAEYRQDSLGTRGATWHPRSRLEFRDIFNNPRENRCLRFRCGGRYMRNQSFLLDTPSNKAILDQVCFAASGSHPELPFKVDQERTGQSAQAMAQDRGSFGKVYKTNPEWFKLENVCKGIPCLLKKGKKLKFLGVVSKILEGKPCAVGKTCQNRVCKEPELTVLQTREPLIYQYPFVFD